MKKYIANLTDGASIESSEKEFNNLQQRTVFYDNKQVKCKAIVCGEDFNFFVLFPIDKFEVMESEEK